MSVLVVTTAGRFVVDLFRTERPAECAFFAENCRRSRYNLRVFTDIARDRSVQVHGDVAERCPVGSAGPGHRHSRKGLVSLARISDPKVGQQQVGSGLLVTLSDAHSAAADDGYLAVGEIAEGHEILTTFNTTPVDAHGRPMEDIVILHTYVVEDPSDAAAGAATATAPESAPEPVPEPEPTPAAIAAIRYSPPADPRQAELESKALTLEVIGGLDRSIAPSEKVLFICRLNPVTKESDLDVIFQRFGHVVNVEIIRDRDSGKSLCYGFIEFDSAGACEAAYAKMDNALIDDRRVHVDFSQSVSKERRAAEQQRAEQRQWPQKRSRAAETPQGPQGPRRKFDGFRIAPSGRGSARGGSRGGSARGKYRY